MRGKSFGHDGAQQIVPRAGIVEKGLAPGRVGHADGRKKDRVFLLPREVHQCWFTSKRAFGNDFRPSKINFLIALSIRKFLPSRTPTAAARCARSPPGFPQPPHWSGRRKISAPPPAPVLDLPCPMPPLPRPPKARCRRARFGQFPIHQCSAATRSEE